MNHLDRVYKDLAFFVVVGSDPSFWKPFIFSLVGRDKTCSERCVL